MHRWIGIATLVGSMVTSTSIGYPAFAATLLVAVNGIDGATCGPTTSPCRTITRAIANAVDGDTVVVGPGRYGDVDGDHALSGSQEEPPNLNGCGCAIEIGKRVTVVARDGAAATVIDGGGAVADAVRLSADGAVFGRRNRGFTLTGGTNQSALRVVANEATIAGHVFTRNYYGMVAQGSRNVVASCRFFGNGPEALLMIGDDNLVTETAISGADAIAFNIAGDRNTLKGVVAVQNFLGIAFLGTNNVVTGSVVNANAGPGIEVTGTGNSVTIAKTNLVGNGTDSPVNCGLLITGTGNTVAAAGNYWGAATGPGSDPADAVCVGGGTAVTTPFSSAEFKTPTKALR